MNQNQLLDLFDGVDDRFVMEAIDSRGGGRTSIPKCRVLLIAAAIAVAALLMGCVAAYLWLEELPTDPGLYDHFDFETNQWVLPESPNPDRVLFVGALNSPIAKAAAEWQEYSFTYIIDDPLFSDKTGYPHVADNYQYIYGCHTPEMVDKLHEIMDKYRLKPAEETLHFEKYHYEIFTELLDIESLTRPGSPVSLTSFGGYMDAPYNFKIECTAVLDTREFGLTLNYRHKDYMPRDAIWILKLDEFEQWQYTNADGLSLFMALDPGFTGVILAEQEQGYITLSVSDRHRNQMDKILDREDLEQFADSVNFNFTPQDIRLDELKPTLEKAEQSYEFASGILFNSFEDCLKRHYPKNWLRAHNTQYAWADLFGDGSPELLLGWGPEYGPYLCETVVFQNDYGIVEELAFSPTYFCENNVFAAVNGGVDNITYEFWQMSEDFMSHIRLVQVMHVDGKWYKDYFGGWEELGNVPTITEAEAQAILAKYPRREIRPDWKPLRDFPLSDGGTLGGE